MSVRARIKPVSIDTISAFLPSDRKNRQGKTAELTI
jgi:hypothetical protein